MKGFTNKRLAREKLLAGIFERFEKVNGPVKDFCEKEGIPVSVFYYWKDRFHHDGLKGLVDKRQGKPYKAKDEVKRYICDIKMKDSSKSASELCALVERRFVSSPN